MGAAIAPQWSIPARPNWVQSCADGFWGLLPGILQTGGTITEKASLDTAIHEIGHWLGLSHTWAENTPANITDKAAACAASANYTSISTVSQGDSDAVRDTPPQANFDNNKAVFFKCSGPNNLFTPTQSCTTATGFPSGDSYYANGANMMVSDMF